jgi:hypothetical protein
MKTKNVLMLVLCAIASAGIVPVAEADILSRLMANPPQAPYVDEQVQAAQKPALQKSTVGSQDSRHQSRTVLITPGSAQSTRQHVPAQALQTSQLRPQAAVSMKSVSRQAAASELRPASAPPAARHVQVADRQTSDVRGKKAQPRVQQRQTQPVFASTYVQPAQQQYAPQYAQQPTHASAPNYSQGYAYQNWRSTNAANCGPGRV